MVLSSIFSRATEESTYLKNAFETQEMHASHCLPSARRGDQGHGPWSVGMLRLRPGFYVGPQLMNILCVCMCRAALLARAGRSSSERCLTEEFESTSLQELAKTFHTLDTNGDGVPCTQPERRQSAGLGSNTAPDSLSSVPLNLKSCEEVSLSELKHAISLVGKRKGAKGKRKNSVPWPLKFAYLFLLYSRIVACKTRNVPPPCATCQACNAWQKALCQE